MLLAVKKNEPGRKMTASQNETLLGLANSFSLKPAMKFSARTGSLAVFFILGLLVFGACFGFEFLAYDDRLNILDNPHFHAHNPGFFWTHSYFNLFVPVIYSVWYFVYSVFSMNSHVYHGLNILFHIVNAWLIFTICTQKKLTTQASLLAGAIFLLHPLQVEPVAWVTGFKDVFSLFLGLLSVRVYLQNKTTFSAKLTLLLLITLAVLSKPTAVVLPALLLVTSFAKSSFKQNWHLFTGLLFGVLNAGFARQLQAPDPAAFDPSLFQRVILVLDSLGFYVVKFFLPLELFPDYGRTPQMVFENHEYILNLTIALLFLAALIMTLVKIRKAAPAFFHPALFFTLFGGLFFLPTSGILNFGYQQISTVADRYFYAVCVAFAFLAALGFSWLEKKNQRLTRFGAVAVVAILASCSFVQVLTWRNNQIFFEYMLEGNSQSYNAANNLGVLAKLKGENERALTYFRQAQVLRPLDMTPIAGLMSVYYAQRRHNELDELAWKYFSEEKFKKMILPGHSTSIAFELYGYSLKERGRLVEAFDYFCRASGTSPLAARELAEVIAELGAELQKVCASN